MYKGGFSLPEYEANLSLCSSLQEGEMALAAKRRRLSQADGPGSSSQQSETASQSSLADTTAEGKAALEEKPPPPKRRRGRPPKNQRVWSPSGGRGGVYVHVYIVLQHCMMQASDGGVN